MLKYAYGAVLGFGLLLCNGFSSLMDSHSSQMRFPERMSYVLKFRHICFQQMF